MTKYLIKKGDRYWKKNNIGYSFNKDEAKEFSKEEATEIISLINSDKTMVPV